MKQLSKSNVLTVCICLAGAMAGGLVQASDRPVLRATTFKVLPSELEQPLRSLHAKIDVHCTFRWGLVWPETKFCGDQELTAPVDADGNVLLPTIEKFTEKWGSDDRDHYEVNVSVYDGTQYLFSISATHEDSLNRLEKFAGKALYVTKILPARIERVLIEGQILFGSEFSKRDKAQLGLFVVRDFSKETLSSRLGFFVFSPLLSGSIYNGNNDHSTKTNRLENQTAMETKMVVSVLLEPKPEAVKLRLDYREVKLHSLETTYSAELGDLIPKNDMLSAIKQIELSKIAP